MKFNFATLSMKKRVINIVFEHILSNIYNYFVLIDKIYCTKFYF